MLQFGLLGPGLSGAYALLGQSFFLLAAYWLRDVVGLSGGAPGG